MTQFVENTPGATQQYFALRRHADAAVVAIEKADPERSLELPDGLRQGGLRQADLARGPQDAARSRHCQQQPQLAQRHAPEDQIQSVHGYNLKVIPGPIDAIPQA